MSFQKDEVKPPGITAMVIVASLSLHLLSLALPLALLQTYDRLLPNKAYTTTFVLAAGVTLAILCEAGLRYARSVLFAQVGAVFESHTTVRLIDRLLRTESKASSALGTLALMDAVKAVGQVRDYWSGNAAVALHELPFMVIYIGLIAYIGSWLALIPLALTLLALLAAWLISRAARDVAHEINSVENRLRTLMWGIFGAITEVKAMGAEVDMTRRYRELMGSAMDARSRQENAMSLIRENGILLGQLATIGIVTFGAFMVARGDLTIGGLAGCTLLAGRSINPAMGAFVYLNRLADRDEARNKIEAVMSLPLAPLWNSHGQQAFNGGAITLKGDAIEGGIAQVPPGSVAHVQAGDALTADAALGAIAGLDDTLNLAVSFDGQPGAAYDSLSLRQGIAMVDTHTYLLQGSLLDNLTLFSPQYDPDAIQLARLMGLNPFIETLPQGVMTPVGKAGSSIVSEGSAVRIGLVRALIRRPLVLCLNNVGASLDLDGMRRLMEVLQKLKGHITVFLVSNNPTLLQLVDVTIRVKGQVEHG